MSPAIWRPERLPSVVLIAPAPQSFAAGNLIHLDDLPPVLARVTVSDGDHLLLADPEGTHQIWFADDVAQRGGCFIIPPGDDFAARKHAVERLERRLAGQCAGPPIRSQQLSPRQREYLTLQLRALDGVADQASRREIAAVLLDPAAYGIPAIEWKNAALRKRINRIIASAMMMVNSGYLTLLRGDAERARRFHSR